MKKIALLLGLISTTVLAWGTAQADCTQIAGDVISGPTFQNAGKNQYLTHTTFLLKQNGQTGKTYKVVIDNIFTSSYNRNNPDTIPAELNAIETGKPLTVCGLTYTDKSSQMPGIHWVHANCKTPATSNPAGYVLYNGSKLTENTGNCDLL